MSFLRGFWRGWGWPWSQKIGDQKSQKGLGKRARRKNIDLYLWQKVRLKKIKNKKVDLMENVLRKMKNAIERLSSKLSKSTWSQKTTRSKALKPNFNHSTSLKQHQYQRFDFLISLQETGPNPNFYFRYHHPLQSRSNILNLDTLITSTPPPHDHHNRDAKR